MLQAEKFKKEAPTQEHCRLLTLELVFLWHTLPTCGSDDLKPFLNGSSLALSVSLLALLEW